MLYCISLIVLVCEISSGVLSFCFFLSLQMYVILFFLLGFGSGWDIIIPAGWSSSVWLSLVLRGARVGGIRESESLAFESGSSLWYPDTQATQKESEQLEKQSKLEYFR